MNSIRKWIRNAFGFSRNEINGFLVLIPLMLLLIFSEPAYHGWIANQDRGDLNDVAILDSLMSHLEKKPHLSEKRVDAQSVSHFSFDPNTASVNDFKHLGISETLAKRIAAYRAKGGVFRIKSDLLKIYGLDSALYEQLYVYIRLPSRRLSTGQADTTRSKFRARATGKNALNKTFDINTADTLLLESVYGIGPKLAARIIKFREALGGFVKEEQLYEVYGLDSIVVTRLLNVAEVKADFIPEKINVNAADVKTLSGHPYIRYKIAGALVSYRFQHGDFLQVNDIKKLSALQPDDVERLLPYLKVKD